MSGSPLSSIISIYKDELISISEGIPSDKNVELEYRIGLSGGKKFNYDKARILSSFERFMKDRNINHEDPLIQEDYIIDNKRYTKNKNGNISMTTKDRLLKININEATSNLFDSKIALSSEEDKPLDGQSLYLSYSENNNNGNDSWNSLTLDERNVWESGIPDILEKWSETDGNIRRKKNRKSYLYSSHSRIDVTYVNTMIKGGKPTSSYEIEVELISDINSESLEDFVKAIEFTSKLVEVACVIKDYNLWTSPSDPIINYNGFSIKNSSKPRNFKKRDFVWGGLIPYDGDEEKTIYSITVKGDGLRKNIVIHESGVWIIRPKRGFPIADRLSLGLSPKISTYKGSVIDGELMEDGTFIPFDCMAFNYKPTIQKFPHMPISKEELVKGNSRIMRAKLVCDTLSEIMKISYKKFFVLGNNREKAIDSIRKCKEYLNVFPFKTDGYIFTPINYQYKTPEGTSLLRQPDTTKLKPWDRLSIDFFFNSSEKVPMVYKDQKLVSFLEEEKSFTVENFVVPPFLDTTVEMEPVREENKIVLHFRKVREDKGANMLKVARDVWKDINDPLDLEDLTGDTFRFNRLYQNGVKTKIIDNITKGSYVLDIGSGNGGDLSKYNKRGISKLFAIDPNENNMNEFIRRVDLLQPKTFKYETLLAGGEEYDLIANSSNLFFSRGGKNNKTLYIISMLSLSFFWKDRETLASLSKTLNKVSLNNEGEVYFLFYTIEAGRTLSFFDKKGSDNIQVGPVKLSLNRKEEILYLDYPGTIVGKQTEYLVYLKDLESFLNQVTGKENKIEVFSASPSKGKGQFILSDDEMLYSSMYAIGFVKLK